MKEKVSNMLALLEMGAYCIATCYRSLAVNHCVCSLSLHFLLISTFATNHCVYYSHHQVHCSNKKHWRINTWSTCSAH